MLGNELRNTLVFFNILLNFRFLGINKEVIHYVVMEILFEKKTHTLKTVNNLWIDFSLDSMKTDDYFFFGFHSQ